MAYSSGPVNLNIFSAVSFEQGVPILSPVDTMKSIHLSSSHSFGFSILYHDPSTDFSSFQFLRSDEDR